MSSVPAKMAGQMRVDGPFQDLTYRIIGTAMEVHNEVGPGLKESVHHHGLTLKLREAGMSCEEEVSHEISLDGTWIGLLYLDLVVEESVVVEVKAVAHMLTNEELAQVITYLTATGCRAGVLINFGRQRLEYRRVLAQSDRPIRLEAKESMIRLFAPRFAD